MWRRLGQVAATAIRVVGVGAIAGLAAGAVAAVGSRAAMWLVGLSGGPTAALSPAHAVVAGGRTSGGYAVGEFSLAGTLVLVLYSGAFAGIFGGLLYVAFRRWLVGLGRWRGISFGVLLLLTFGSLLFAGPDSDSFRRFGSPALNVALFALLFPLFGLVVAPLAEGLDRALRGRPPSVAAAPAYLLIGTAAAVGSMLVVSGLISAVPNVLSGAGDPFGLLPAPLLAALLAHVLVRRGGAAAVAADLLVIAPVLVGLPFTARAILDLVLP